MLKYVPGNSKVFMEHRSSKQKYERDREKRQVRQGASKAKDCRCEEGCKSIQLQESQGSTNISSKHSNGIKNLYKADNYLLRYSEI